MQLRLRILRMLLLIAGVSKLAATVTPTASTEYQAILLQWPLAGFVGWNDTTDVCSWPQVVCAAGELTELWLDQPGLELTGTLPEAWGQLLQVWNKCQLVSHTSCFWHTHPFSCGCTTLTSKNHQGTLQSCLICLFCPILASSSITIHWDKFHHHTIRSATGAQYHVRVQPVPVDLHTLQEDTKCDLCAVLLQLQSVSMEFNHLTGPLPNSWGNLTNVITRSALCSRCFHAWCCQKADIAGLSLCGAAHISGIV